MSAVAAARRPGLRSMGILVACETRMVVRDTAGLIVPIGLPLLILVTSAGSAGDERLPDGTTVLERFVLPLVFVLVTATIGIVNMPSFLAHYRRSGILRRLAVTPASPLMVLVAQWIVSALQTAIGIGLALAVAMSLFGVGPPRDPGVVLGVLVLSMASMGAIGMIVAAIAPTPNSAVAIGLVLFLGLGALGGMFGGRQALPAPLAEFGGVLPFGAAVEALGSAWAGAALDPVALLALAGSIVVGAAVAGALFRWE